MSVSLAIHVNWIQNLHDLDVTAASKTAHFPDYTDVSLSKLSNLHNEFLPTSSAGFSPTVTSNLKLCYGVQKRRQKKTQYIISRLRVSAGW